MGTLLDSTVFIEVEREWRRRGDVIAEIARRMAQQLGPDEELAIAAITASELLQGVHRADDAHRPRREAFVEAVLETFPTIPFDLRSARTHSRLWAKLAAAGADIGPHDRLIAATALALGWRLVTSNLRHFRHVAGLEVLELTLD